MAMQKIAVRPGVNTEQTQTLNEGGYSTCALVRFRNGLLEKIGGWLALSIQACTGIVRALHAWIDLAGISYLAIGSNLRLELYTAGLIHNITPVIESTTASFTATIGSQIVTVHDVANMATAGEEIAVVSVALPGFTLAGYYTVVTILGPDDFTIDSGIPATGNGNVPAAAIIYFLAPGPVSSTSSVPLRNWYLDNFGENLVAVPTNGALYQWTPPYVGNAATLVATAPTINAGMFVAMPQAQVIMLGSETGGVQDPLLIRWSDIGDYTNFTAASTNQAGSYRLSRGSRIVGGLQAPQLTLVWTDLDLWAMQYIQPPFIYGFNIIAENCGLIAPKAMGILGTSVLWMSLRGFFIMDGGGVRPLPCSVWDQVFQNLDLDNADKSFAAVDSPFNEVFFFYPSLSGSGEIDSYVKVNMLENVWDYGPLVRTAWTDVSVFGMPIAVDGSGLLQQHEQGYNNNASAMTGVFAETGFIDIADGQDFIYIDQLIPDMKWQGNSPSIQWTVYTTIYPGGTVATHGPFTVTPTTTFISLRARARQIAHKIQCDTLGTWFRWGAPRHRGAPSGRA